MRDSELIERARKDIAQLERFLPHLRHVRSDFHLWGEVGYPSGGGTRTSAGAHNDPVQRAAIAALDRKKSDFERAYAKVEDYLEHVHTAARQLDMMRQLATTVRATVPGDPGCMSCGRARDETGHAIWSRVYQKSKSSRLCRWCYEFKSQYDVLPAPGLVVLQARGYRITTKLIGEHHPDLIDRLNVTSNSRTSNQRLTSNRVPASN